MSETEAASSSSDPTEITDTAEKIEEFIEPDKKRRKIDKKLDARNEKLEHRLGGILCCAVCLDLPKAAIYQVFLTNQLILTVFYSYESRPDVWGTWCMYARRSRPDV